MYPGSNPELVAAVSAAGGLGVVQPISLTHLYGHDFREGLRLIKRLTDKPFGVNLTIMPQARYMRQTDTWMNIAIEEGVKFFLTSLGKPDPVVRKAEENHGVVVYHDVHTPEVAMKVLDSGVHGLNCLNDRMGGQTGNRNAEDFALSLLARNVKVPLVCSGGVAASADLAQALDHGYAGVLVGTRFLATDECLVTRAYKEAIVAAGEEDIVWTNKMAGTNSSVIRTPSVERGGLRVSRFVAWLLRNPSTKDVVRMAMLTRSLGTYKKAAFDETFQYWQAGKGVAGIAGVESVATVMARFAAVYAE